MSVVLALILFYCFLLALFCCPALNLDDVLMPADEDALSDSEHE